MNRIAALYKKAYSGLSPSIWWLSVVMLINRCGTMVVPFMTLYLTESKDYSISQAGLVMAFFGGGAICGGFIGGKLTDKLGFHWVQLLALAGGGCMFLLLGQMVTFPYICVTSFFLSLINESFRPANAAAIAHYSSEENRTRSYSLNRLATNLGWALGSTLGGLIAAHNYAWLFWIDGLTNISAAAMLWFVLSPSKSNTKRHDTIAPIQTDQNIRSAYRDKPYMAYIIFTAMFGYCFFQIFSTIPLFYKKGLGLTETYIGMVMAMNGVIIVVMEMVLIHRLEGKRHNLHYVVWGVLFFSASFLVLNFLPGKGMVAVVSMIIVTIGEMLCLPFMNSFWISRTKPGNRGQYAGLYTVAWSVAQVLGPATGARIADKAGFANLWWFIGTLCIAIAVGYKWLQYRIESKEKLTVLTGPE